MDTLFAILFVAFIGALVGWYAREQYAVNNIKHLMDELEVKQEQRTKIRIEKHKDTLYAYAADTDEFIGQGATLTDLDKILVAKFPGKEFAIKESNLAELDLKL